MTSGEVFPDWCSPPGETIEDILTDRGLSPYEVAEELGRSLEEINQLLLGELRITIELASQLEVSLGGSAEFWLTRDYQYWSDKERTTQEVSDWLASLPLSDMRRYGWVKVEEGSGRVLQTVLEFFDVSSYRAWLHAYESILGSARLRTSKSFSSNDFANAAWLRQGELISQEINCGSWDPEGFKQALVGIRQLTRQKQPSKFLPKLQGICSEYGVAVVIVPAPKGCRASGAAQFLRPDKALVQLSGRFRTDDQLWFTFFHEAGHLLLHGTNHTFVDEAELRSYVEQEELEANQFAFDHLFPGDAGLELARVGHSHQEVLHWARKVGVSPGIVVGQLQFMGKLPHSHLNRLKRRYRWDDAAGGMLTLESA